MDNREQFEGIMEMWESEGAASSLEELILALAPNTPPPPSSPPPFPSGPPAPPQPAAENQSGGSVLNTLLGSAPPLFQHQLQNVPTPMTTLPAQLYCQPGRSSQAQCDVPEIPNDMLQYLCPVGELHGVPVWDFGTPAPPPNSSTPKKRKRQSQQGEHGPYVKKPPNAFMLYLKEQRPKIKAELNITGSAAVNAAVGAKWKSLSKQEQSKYFDEAETQRRRHANENPEWSSKENYGKKRKRARPCTSSTASASTSSSLASSSAPFQLQTEASSTVEDLEELLSLLEEIDPITFKLSQQPPFLQSANPL